MTKKTFALILSFILCLNIKLNATNNTSAHWSFDLTSDFVYYPLVDFVPGSSHFAPISGALDTLAFRFTGNANYYIPLNLGSHWIYDDSNLIFQSTLELTPVTFKAQESIFFNPYPFLELQTGVSAAIGWNFGNVMNLYGFNQNTLEYEELSTFKNMYYEWFIKTTIMFDLGYVIPGDWTHVIFLTDYKIYYARLTGIKPKEVYFWQTTPGLTNGWQFDYRLILGYQFPKYVYRTGIILLFSGHFDPKDYGQYTESYYGRFKKISISPFVQLKLSENNMLSFLIEISSRRSFSQAHTKLTEEILLDYSGREWFFNMFGISWEKRF